MSKSFVRYAGAGANGIMLPAPAHIVSMSLQPAIPCRVALQHCPTPLHRLRMMYHSSAQPVNHHLPRAGEFSAGTLRNFQPVLTGAITCPLWMASMSHADMPCSKEHQSPQQCPISICQASSPYVVDSITANAFSPQLFLAAVVDSTPISLSSITGLYEQFDDRSPPRVTDRLFLQTCALLI